MHNVIQQQVWKLQTEKLSVYIIKTKQIEKFRIKKSSYIYFFFQNYTI